MVEQTTFDVPFTQYLLPDGRKRAASFTVEGESVDLVQQILSLDRYRFECEMLRTGEISVTCFDIEDEIDIAIEICPNGPEVPKAIEKMIAAAWAYIQNPPPGEEPAQ